jgi:hypothetical protein
MASIRKLKKDIQFLTAEGISDCINLTDEQDKEKNGKILDIIREIVANHNNIIERICHPDGKDNSKLIRNFFKQVKADYIHGLDQAYKKLEALMKPA